MLAQPPQRPTSLYNHHHYHQPQTSSYNPSARASTENWVSSYTTPTQSDYPESSCDLDYLKATAADQTGLFEYNAPHNFNNLHIHADSSFESSQEPELMPSDQHVAPANWNFTSGQLTPTSARTHYRESSLSSVGSAGPASPYNGSTPHPHVILPSEGELSYDGLPLLDHSAYHTFSKSITPSHTPSQDAFLAPHFPQSYNAHTYNANSHIAALLAMQRQRQAAGDDESMSASEYGNTGRQVANSGDSSVKTAVAGDYDDQTRKNGENAFIRMSPRDEYLQSGSADFRRISAVPKLDRTMSDVYNDELYSPTFTFTAAPSTKVEAMTMTSPSSAVFSQMLQAANEQHLSVPQRSPRGDQVRDQKMAFREGSPLAPVSNGFDSPQMRYGSAQQMRERMKAEQDDRLVQQLQRSSPAQSAPKTISPRDALLDYHETEQDAAMPLFPTQTSPQYLQVGSHAPSQADLEDASSQQSFGSMMTSRRPSSSAYSTASQRTQQPHSNFNFTPPSVPRIRVPQQYPFVSQSRSQPSNLSSLSEQSPSYVPPLPTMESTSSDYTPNSTTLQKPHGSTADGGTYTCTYQNCTQRFETPAKLQKHKREGHRQANTQSGGIPASTQAGPHRCMRLNPSTNKICNTVFSRPYDLTRHEDTIHNARKIKVRCPLCKEEKTFSRNDALTRHLKLVHPLEIVVPSKKRGGAL